MKLQVSTLGSDTAAGEIELNDEVFGLEPRADILHRVVVWQLHNRRAPARAARERSDVARTGKKFGKQKGGGTARHGDRAAPIFIGGGKAHGPRARVFESSLNKKIRALGLKMALSAKAKEGKLVVMDSIAVEDGRTRTLVPHFAAMNTKSALVIDGSQVEQTFARAAANVPHLDILPAQGANVYDILRAETLVLTRAGVEKLEARFNG